jgi:hypothetical protein
MKVRRSVCWFVVISAVLIALIVWFGKKPAEKPLPAVAETDTAPPVTQRAAEPSQRERRSTPRTNSTAGQATTVASAPVPPTQTKDEQMREGLATLNDEQVVLYGRVIDQFGAPVAGATVAASIQVNNGVRVGADRFSLNTDANGAFTISGYKGKALGINITKAGYDLATTNTRFVYSLLWPEAERHVHDPNNPVVFKMWKRQGVEPLVGIDQRYRLQVTDTPVNFDLLTGKIVPSGGDLRITVDRPSGIVSQRQPQDWGLKIEAVNGGLIETSFAEARVTYQAPENGYQPSDTLAVSTTNHWSDLVQQMLFVSSRNGQVYSKVFVSLSINANPDETASVTFRGAANANASRNWEEPQAE